MYRGILSTQPPPPDLFKVKTVFDASSRCNAFSVIRTYVSIRQIAICYITDIQHLVFMHFIALYLVKIIVLID